MEDEDSNSFHPSVMYDRYPNADARPSSFSLAERDGYLTSDFPENIPKWCKLASLNEMQNSFFSTDTPKQFLPRVCLPQTTMKDEQPYATFIDAPLDRGILEGKDDSSPYKNKNIMISVIAVGLVAVIVAIPLTIVLVLQRDATVMTEDASIMTEGKIALKLSLDELFVEDMAVPNSNISISTGQAVCAQVDLAFTRDDSSLKDSYADCTLTSLRNGSIVVRLEIRLTGTFTAPANSVFINIINNAIGSTGLFGQYRIIRDSIEVETTVYITGGVTNNEPSVTTIDVNSNTSQVTKEPTSSYGDTLTTTTNPSTTSVDTVVTTSNPPSTSVDTITTDATQTSTSVDIISTTTPPTPTSVDTVTTTTTPISTSVETVTTTTTTPTSTSVETVTATTTPTSTPVNTVTTTTAPTSTSVETVTTTTTTPISSSEDISNTTTTPTSTFVNTVTPTTTPTSTSVDTVTPTTTPTSTSVETVTTTTTTPTSTSVDTVTLTITSTSTSEVTVKTTTTPTSTSVDTVTTKTTPTSTSGDESTTTTSPTSTSVDTVTTTTTPTPTSEETVTTTTTPTSTAIDTVTTTTAPISTSIETVTKTTKPTSASVETFSTTTIPTSISIKTKTTTITPNPTSVDTVTATNTPASTSFETVATTDTPTPWSTTTSAKTTSPYKTTSMETTTITGCFSHDITISGNTTIREGERYDVTCTGNLSTTADLHLYRITTDSTERLTVNPIVYNDVSNDSCHYITTKTYNILAEKSQNGTGLKCGVTEGKLSSNISSIELTMRVVAADVRMALHLQNTSWIPAFDDASSAEFKSFAAEIEQDMDVVYSNSQFSENYQRTTVLSLAQGSVIVNLVVDIILTITVTDPSGNTFTVKLNIQDIVNNIADTIQSLRDSGKLNSSLVNTDTGNINGAITTEQELPEDACSSQTDIVFLLDSSGSIGGDNFITMKYFVQNFTAGLEIGAAALQLGVVKFSSSPNTEFGLNEHDSPLNINNAVEGIIYTGGGTRIGAALEYVRSTSFLENNGSRMNTSQVIILMTDGQSGDSPDVVANTLRDEGVIIVCIGIGNGVNNDQLNAIAYNSSFVFHVTNFNVLIDIKKIVQDTSCSKNG